MLMEIHVDTVIRLMAMGAGVLLLLLLMLGEVRNALKLPLAGMIVGGVLYLFNSSNSMGVGSPFFEPLDLISLTTPFWLWVFAHRLFDRELPRYSIIPIAIAYISGWFAVHFVPGTGLAGFYLNHITSLILVGHIIYLCLSGLGDDLVYRRRLVRIYLPILIGMQSAGILIYEMIYGTQDASPLVQSINASLIFILFILGGLAMLRADSDLLLKTDLEKSESKDTVDLSASETVLHEKLTCAMGEGAFREAGLTIRSLAQQLGTPEHRLRALINRKLGHRNFSSFLNGYRISEAKKKLADRDAVDLPILTIAMDLGYNSLAPFNRAFRAETGQTPSDFRKEAIDQN